MIKLTDLFIHRPVLSSVISFLILLFGLRAMHGLPLREFPQMESAVVTVATSYAGASADLMQGFITAPLAKAVASAEGIDYITTESSEGGSIISAYIKLNFNPDTAFTNIMSAVSSARNQLPKDAEEPVINKDTGSKIALMYLSFDSDQMSPEQITDYIDRVVLPKLETVKGVAKADILGGRTFAMRIWLNPAKMAALHISPAELVAALQANNFQSAAGATKGEYVAFNIDTNTNLKDVKEFENIALKTNNGIIVRLKDVARVQLGSQYYESSVIFNGQQAVFVSVMGAPTANPVTVAADIRELLPSIMKNFPPSLKGTIVYDATKYIRASIHEVIKTIAEATFIVILVIFLFLGSIRPVIIPVITIPLSLVGVCTFMLALGYSLNLLTLLAMVLAIGLVVDDAIVVVENIYRHIEKGATPFNAAIAGAREIALPVIAMTITLAAVYAPIGFMTGVTGSLFKEFAFTLAGSVVISGIIALTLSPMMCSRLLNKELASHAFVHFLDANFAKLKDLYQSYLHKALDYRPMMIVMGVTVLVSCFFLYANTKHELAPDEDQSVVFISATAPQYANIDYVTQFTKEFNKIFADIPETDNYFIVNGMGAVNNVISGLMLKPWNERKSSQQEVQEKLQAKLTQVAGLNTVSFPLPSLPVGGDGLPIQFVITSTASFEQIYEAMQSLQEAARKSGLFLFLDSSLKFNKPQMLVNIDRSKAASLGINMQDIGTTLAATLGGNYINRFSMEGQSYQVIPQVSREFRLNPRQLGNIYLKSAAGELIPLATIATFNYKTQPNSLAQFQQLNASTLQGLMMPGKTIGDGLKFLQTQADNILPKGMSYDYSGQSRQFIQEGNALIYAFFFAIIVIFLVLAAQFESFRDPLIILISVPLSICGALIPLNLGMASINIYTQIGLITLIGLISKHGILMVQFANALQESQGLSIRAAIEEAAATRLRPILMTTAAMILGVLPLILADGAGAKSRFDIGLVIATGMAVGTIFTLFVVPTAYTLLAKDHNKIKS